MRPNASAVVPAPATRATPEAPTAAATPPSAATPPAADASATASQFKVGATIKDAQGVTIGTVARVIKTPDGATTISAGAIPGADAFPTSPVSEDAVLLATLRILPQYAGGGLARVLVQAVVKDVLNRGGIRAIEVFGDHRAGEPRGCVVPADFWLRVGFKTHRSHLRYPRLRMDMRSVLTWREEVEQALEKLLGVVRPRPVPAPATKRTIEPQ
mgnify:CR=1 FL=1